MPARVDLAGRPLRTKVMAGRRVVFIVTVIRGAVGPVEEHLIHGTDAANAIRLAKKRAGVGRGDIFQVEPDVIFAAPKGA